MKKVAIILANLESRERRKYQLFPDEVRGGGVHIRCFSVNPNAGQSKLSHFDGGKKGLNLSRFLAFLLSSPKEFASFFKAQRSKLGTIKSLKVWSQLAPLYLWKPDVVHFVEQGLVPIVKPLPNSVKTVVSFRGGDIMVTPFKDARWQDYLTQELFPATDCVHLISRAMYDAAVSFAGDRENFKKITMGIDLDLFKPIERNGEQGTVRIVTTARLSWQKGLPTALRVIKRLIEQGLSVKYDIIGDGVLRLELERLIKELNLEDEVVLHGQKDLEAVRQILSAGDIYFQPSVTESLCVAIMEAMAMELPVVASDVGGIPEIVIEGKTGILVPAEDIDAMTEALGKLAQDPNLRIRLGKKGREIVLEKFSLEKERASWLEQYRQL